MEEAMIAKAAENAAIEKSTYKQNLNDKSDSNSIYKYICLLTIGKKK
jgi:hypothetical protein